MEKLIHCRNSECLHYYEDGYWYNKKMVIIDENGNCESFEKGINEMYAIDDETYKEIIKENEKGL